MYYLWITLSLIAITAIVVRPVSNAAALVLIVGTLYYGIPLFYGNTAFVVSYLPFQMYTGSPPGELYLYFSYLLIAGTIALNVPTMSPLRDVNIATRLSGPLLLVAGLFLSAEIAMLGVDVYTTYAKVDLLEAFSSLYSYHQMAYCLAAVTIIGFSKRPGKFYLAALFILFALDVLIVGMRGVPAFAFLSALFARGVNFEIRVSRKVKMLGLASFLPLLVIVTLWQPAYYLIKNWNNAPDISGYITNQFENFSSMRDTVIMWGEPNASMGLATETIKSGFSFDSNAFDDLFLSVFPFLGSFGFARINPQAVMQQQFFPEITWGLAASYPGQLYAFFGYLGLLIHTVIMFVLAVIKVPKSSIMRLMYFYLLPYFFFYFFRNSIFSYSNLLKSLVVTILLAYVVMLFVDIISSFFCRRSDSLHS